MLLSGDRVVFSRGAEMYRYDDVGFRPPAPVVEAEVRAPAWEKHRSAAVRMILDSGADITCLPATQPAVEDSSLEGVVTVYGYTRRPQVRRTRFVDLIVAGRELRNVEVLPISDDVGLIGRDVLNRLRLQLDGPGLVWLVLDENRQRGERNA